MDSGFIVVLWRIRTWFWNTVLFSFCEA
jgi:hypothetical protein